MEIYKGKILKYSLLLAVIPQKILDPIVVLSQTLDRQTPYTTNPEQVKTRHVTPYIVKDNKP